LIVDTNHIASSKSGIGCPSDQTVMFRLDAEQSTNKKHSQMTALIQKSIQRQDDLVLEFSYCDSKGKKTRRVVSPIRLLGKDRFLGLCLSREQPRQFYLNRCDAMELKPAYDYVMPVPMVDVA
jgi:predicted DNA-binding transcriptional regulator YafY